MGFEFVCSVSKYVRWEVVTSTPTYGELVRLNFPTVGGVDIDVVPEEEVQEIFIVNYRVKVRYFCSQSHLIIFLIMRIE